MLPRSDKARRVHPDCPAEVKRDVDVMLATSLSGKPFFAGETLADVVKRHCPQIFDGPAAHGFELRFDLEENSHHALIKGRMAYQIRRKPSN
jgi:hypothetical protein